MDEAQSLEALAKVLNDISERPYDIGLHIQHTRLAQSMEGMEAQVKSALEMLTDFLAAGKDAWTFLIEEKEKAVNLETAEGVEELLALYARAEADYISMPILQKHLQFIIDHHQRYHGADAELKSDALNDLFSTAWTRTAIAEVVSKGIGHLTASHLLWDLQRDWELQQLESVTGPEKASLADAVQLLFLTRLRQPHAGTSHSEETSQYYSTFTTNHRPPDQYEALLIAASKLRAQAVKAFERREPFERALTDSNGSLKEYARYIAYERRARNPDLFVMNGVYERAIAQADVQRFSGQEGAEAALKMFWVGYCDSLRINQAGPEVELTALKRAARSVPGSGEIWARYIRAVERYDGVGESAEEVAEIFNQAFNTKLLQNTVAEIVPVTLARAGYERRRMEADPTDEDILPTLIAILEKGIEMVHQASKTGDAKLRLEKYLSEIYHSSSLHESATIVWESAAKFYKTSYIAWTSYTDSLIKYQQYDKARKVFSDIHMKNLDWPEAVWEAWIAFEHLHGSVEELDTCLDKVEKAQYQVNARRAKEAEKANYEALQIIAEAQASVPVTAAPVPDVDVPMDVDVPRERGTKREAEEEPPAAYKKPRMEQKTPPLKRDRENCTVFVGDLARGVTEEDLAGLFKDCGKVREVKITPLPTTIVATVEFFERDSVPAALTKDKKKVLEEEVAVHLAWKSTLYVTNFPESADDAAIRDLFGQYGTIFDVRWPSKKFKNTRRFCYVQFTSPTFADNALELHGRELEPNQPMHVFISNPERKKERTDQDANEREIYVAGLSKFTAKVDLDKLFKTYGTIKEVRMATDEKGQSKGFAFIEYEQEKDALAALGANNHELKKRRIAVTLADSRGKARSKNTVADSGLSKIADTRSRSVRIRNLPATTQEGLLQQTLEKIAAVKRVEVFVDQQEAVVELENAAEAGKLLLRSDPIVFNGNILQLTEEGRDGGPARQAAPPAKTGGLFIPRKAVSRPRAGLGHARKLAVPTGSSSATPAFQHAASSTDQGKGQDDFRKMLGGP